MAQAGRGTHPLTAAWEVWKAAYLEPDGRVVDRLQQGASHSESQGYGLLLAATVGDEAAFDSINAWTMSNLRMRPDHLFAWRWLPDSATNVPDRNNASDGDLFYAWGLIRGAVTLQRPELIDRATDIATDLAAACIQPHPDGSGRLVFTPAAGGFQRDEGLIVNPSYMMPLAMREVAASTGVSAFARCADDSVRIITDLAQGGLVPDWIELRPGGAVPAEGMSNENGYEAMRVPLFLVWSGQQQHLAVRRQSAAYADADTARGATPTVLDRGTGVVLETSSDPGYSALAGLSLCVTSTRAGALMPRFSTRQPYYPATLHLMTLLAQFEAVSRCVPI
ncbi:endoglucanase [Wenxinia marina]|nr:endoglucanase [Wenxinia marina]